MGEFSQEWLRRWAEGEEDNTGVVLFAKKTYKL